MWTNEKQETKQRDAANLKAGFQELNAELQTQLFNFLVEKSPSNVLVLGLMKLQGLRLRMPK